MNRLCGINQYSSILIFIHKNHVNHMYHNNHVNTLCAFLNNFFNAIIFNTNDVSIDHIIYLFSSVSSNIATSATPSANSYVFLCSQSNQAGVVGIAWLSGTCDSSGFGRSSVNEYFYTDASTASVRNIREIIIIQKYSQMQ